MKAIVLGEPPAEFAELIAHRRAIGADRYDEVWEGDYHMAPAPTGPHADLDDQLASLLRPLAKEAGLFSTDAVNIGDLTNFRVPDRAVHRSRPAAAWFATAAIVVEVVSPDDESWAKLGFYAEHGVDEVLIGDPRKREVAWFRLADGEYEPIVRSMLGTTPAELAARLDWPPND